MKFETQGNAFPCPPDNYPEWDLPEKAVRKSVEWLPPTVAMANTSTSKEEFPEHQVSPRAAYRPDNKYALPVLSITKIQPFFF